MIDIVTQLAAKHQLVIFNDLMQFWGIVKRRQTHAVVGE
jgi:hypothetical protein